MKMCGVVRTVKGVGMVIDSEWGIVYPYEVHMEADAISALDDDQLVRCVRWLCSLSRSPLLRDEHSKYRMVTLEQFKKMEAA